MIDYLGAIRRESRRFAEAIGLADLDAPVPSCPEWTAADLMWHLARVQYFWGTIVGGLLDSPDRVPDSARPENPALPEFFEEQHVLLAAALESRDPDDVCWSWYDRGQRVGWVLRRQAHEALIHRVDAELVAGARTGVDETLAADGVDEVLTVSIDCKDIPEWSRFEPDGTTAVIATAEREWEMALGRFLGTSPSSGESYDESALLLGPIVNQPSVTIRGSGQHLDLWLWGRGTTEPLQIDGDHSLTATIRAAAIEATQ